MRRLDVIRVVLATVAVIAVAGALVFDTVTTVNQASRALTLARDIEAQRIYLVRTSCEEQNDRHRHTIRVLDQILGRAAHGASHLRRAQLDESRAATVMMIDSLAPLQNCDALVARATVTTR